MDRSQKLFVTDQLIRKKVFTRSSTQARNAHAGITCARVCVYANSVKWWLEKFFVRTYFSLCFAFLSRSVPTEWFALL